MKRNERSKWKEKRKRNEGRKVTSIDSYYERISEGKYKGKKEEKNKEWKKEMKEY